MRGRLYQKMLKISASIFDLGIKLMSLFLHFWVVLRYTLSTLPPANGDGVRISVFRIIQRTDLFHDQMETLEIVKVNY